MTPGRASVVKVVPVGVRGLDNDKTIHVFFGVAVDYFQINNILDVSTGYNTIRIVMQAAIFSPHYLAQAWSDHLWMDSAPLTGNA